MSVARPGTVRAYANSQFVELAGVRTHVQVWQPQGTPTATVVGLHHFYGSSQTFHRLGPRLVAHGLRLVAMDRVGFGLTDRPSPGRRWRGSEAPYTRGFAVRQVEALLDRLEVERAVVTGTSMGGTVALETALAHPDRVAHVVPCSAPLAGDASAPPWLRPVLRVRGMSSLGATAVRRLAGTIDHDRVGRSWHDPSDLVDADVDAHARFREAAGWERGLWWAWISDDPPALPQRLPELAHRDVQVTAVGATHDRLVRPRIARRAAELAGGDYVEIDCGHLVHVEGARELAELVVGLVDAS